jgi:hypothetical protein
MERPFEAYSRDGSNGRILQSRAVQFVFVFTDQCIRIDRIPNEIEIEYSFLRQIENRSIDGWIMDRG